LKSITKLILRQFRHSEYAEQLLREKASFFSQMRAFEVMQKGKSNDV